MGKVADQLGTAASTHVLLPLLLPTANLSQEGSIVHSETEPKACSVGAV